MLSYREACTREYLGIWTIWIGSVMTKGLMYFNFLVCQRRWLTLILLARALQCTVPNAGVPIIVAQKIFKCMVIYQNKFASPQDCIFH